MLEEVGKRRTERSRRFFVSLVSLVRRHEKEQVHRMDKTFVPEHSGEEDGQYFDQAVTLYRSGSRELTAIIEEIGEGKTDRARKLLGVLSELRKASVTMMEEARNVEDLRRKLVGHVHQPALDLAGARDEIGRRMARLRAVHGAAGVS